MIPRTDLTFKYNLFKMEQSVFKKYFFVSLIRFDQNILDIKINFVKTNFH